MDSHEISGLLWTVEKAAKAAIACSRTRERNVINLKKNLCMLAKQSLCSPLQGEAAAVGIEKKYILTL
jgi:hypothetical protein